MLGSLFDQVMTSPEENVSSHTRYEHTHTLYLLSIMQESSLTVHCGRLSPFSPLLSSFLFINMNKLFTELARAVNKVWNRADAAEE